jgi:hypothetical protein
VNEQIVSMTERFRAQLADVDLVCECASTACTGTIRVGLEEFLQIERAEATFLVLPGHEDISIEDVIDRNGQFVVVRKRDQVVEAVG